MKSLSNKLRSANRGQAILLIALAMVGLVAFVGLLIDVGILFIEQGKLRRGIDAGAIAAAQQFRKGFQAADLAAAAQNFLLLNDSAAANILIYRCGADPASVATGTDLGDGTLQDTDLCTTPRRKLIRVEANRIVQLGFLRVVGLESTDISASAVGEAASIDLVLVIDTSASMSYETGGDPNRPDSNLDDPLFCNNPANATPCQPLAAVKNVALDFLDTMFFPYDRVSVVAMTGQSAGASRDHVTVLQLSDNQTTVTNAINSLRVFEPPSCADNPAYGPCTFYDAGGAFIGPDCPVYRSTGDPSSCNSSNIGGSLLRAGGEFTRTGIRRDEALWIIILLAGGPANATNSAPGYDHGYCPATTWDLAVSPFCRDSLASTRHLPGAEYDADDYARDQADFIADPVDGQGVTVFTIGLGRLVQNASIGDPDAGEQLLRYTAEVAGDTPGVTANHGFYSYAPTTAELDAIFAEIASSIFTRITR